MLTTLRVKSLFSTGPKFTEVEYRSPALILVCVCVCVPTGKLLTFDNVAHLLWQASGDDSQTFNLEVVGQV